MLMACECTRPRRPRSGRGTAECAPRCNSTERPDTSSRPMTEGGSMEGDNLVLVVGSYADAGAADDDFATLKSGEDAGEYQVVGAVVMNRDASGKVEVEEHGDKTVGHGAAWGGGAGLV